MRSTVPTANPPPGCRDKNNNNIYKLVTNYNIHISCLQIIVNLPFVYPAANTSALFDLHIDTDQMNP